MKHYLNPAFDGQRALRLAWAVVLTAILLSLASPAIAEPGRLDGDKVERIDRLIEERISITRAKGVAVALVQDGNVIFTKGYGSSDDELTPVTSQTSFLLGSVTKTFTALAILQMIEEGTLSYDDKVISHLPKFRTQDKRRSDQITIRHLLNQTSGFSGYTGNLYQNESDRPADALQRNVARLESEKLISDPGKRFEYSNANFHVLGLILEEIERKQVESIFAERIWEPLEMRHSFALDPRDESTAASTRYRFWFNQPVSYRRELGRGIVPAGGASSSAEDMAKYLIALLSENPSIISSQTQGNLFSGSGQEDLLGYTNGWFVDKNGPRYLYHDGSIAGATSLIAVFPESKSGMVVLSNTSIGMAFGNIRALEGGVLDIILEQPVRSAEPPMTYRLIYVAVLLISLLLAFWGVRQASSRLRKSNKSNATKARGHFAGTLLQSGALIGLGVALLIGAPALFNSTLTSLYEFLPDISLLLGVSGVMAIAIGVAKIPFSSFLIRK